MASQFHPALTAADRAAMSVNELSFFTDDPVAHAVAYRDYQRARQIETRNAEIAEYLERRQRAIHGFLFDTASVVALVLEAGDA